MGEFSTNLVTKTDLETGTIYTEQRDKWRLSSVPPMKVEPRPRSRTRLRSDKCYWLAFSGSRCHERIVAQCRHRRHGVQNERINWQSLLSAALSGGSYVYPKAIPCLYRESPYAKGLAGGPVRRSLPDLSRLLARRPTVTNRIGRRSTAPLTRCYGHVGPSTLSTPRSHLWNAGVDRAQSSSFPKKWNR